MAYTTIDNQELHFQTALYSGNNTSQSITLPGSGDMKPDMVWLKERNGTEQHNLFDVVRGSTKRLMPDATNAEWDSATNITSFDTDGFSVGSSDAINDSGNNMVAWCWKAGNSAGSANTDGSINSTVSVNTTSKFSIVSYTGTGSAATIGHGLGVAPGLIITKSLVATQEWGIYHKALGATKYIFLNEDTAAGTNSAYWNDVEPTSSVFTVGTSGPTNSTSAMIAYCFAEIPGYSKFGSYTGNGSTNGAFINTGFRPSYVLGKRTNSSEDWFIFDNKRDPHNVQYHLLYGNVGNAEYTSATDRNDFLSNGFKMRTTDGKENGSGDTYIYMAFGQTIVGTNNIPCTAR